MGLSAPHEAGDQFHMACVDELVDRGDAGKVVAARDKRRRVADQNPLQGGTAGEAELLASCYRTSLELACEHGCTSVAFPAVSCGVYGYPLEEAARVSLTAVHEYARSHSSPGLVRWVLLDASAYETWTQAYRSLGRQSDRAR